MKLRLFAVTAALLASCASPEPTYYTLAAQPGPAMTGAPHLIQLRRVGLAGYLDRSDVVDSNAGYRLQISNTERWAEPLSDMAGRVLAEDLTQRLTGSTVFSEAGSIAADTDATVETDIQRFDATPDRQVTLVVQVAISAGHSSDARHPLATQSFRLTAQAGNGTGNTVATMSQLLGQLADHIALMLRNAELRAG